MILGKQVRLRAVERADLPTFVRWFNDPDVRQYIQVFAPMSMVAEERWFEGLQEQKNSHVFCIEAHAGDGWVHIGNCGLHQIDWRNSSAVFGIVLGEKAYWGKGFGTDAAKTVLRFAFRTLNLHRVELGVYDYNPRAIRCYEKAGYRREGTNREAHYFDGAYHDVHVMAVLRDEFQDD